ncbi:MAG: hypothetical protein II838_06620 [Lachnospiraceae bacterium]|nr:hypothetical protein [Lachnospiraceae bacterium]
MSLIDEKWEILFEKYNIENEIKKNGFFYITADQIREVKEPRLMTKFDTRESLPRVFGKKISILPVTRGKYVLGEFDLYQEFPEIDSDIKQMTSAKIPEYYETIDINDIRSEANAINIMSIAGILDDFLGEENMVQTVSGRMSSGSFGFNVSDYSKSTSIGDKPYIIVQNSQVEIDGGFENHNVFSIIEGKNVVHSNFLIRQLYYPTKLWSQKINKPIRPVFMIYSNSIFRLLEYEFTDIGYYNSIKLVQERNYSLEDIEISLDDLRDVWKKTIIKPEPNVTFIQADSFNKVISLVENLNESPMTTVEIAELFGFKERQSDYYFNACKYLGLAEKVSDEEGVKVHISGLGKRILRMKYKERQLEYVRLILEHQIFHELFGVMLQIGEIPDKFCVTAKMRELGVCGENLIDRRSSSVRGWLYWILTLVS